jgi:hypothetical protein
MSFISESFEESPHSADCRLAPAEASPAAVFELVVNEADHS